MKQFVVCCFGLLMMLSVVVAEDEDLESLVNHVLDQVAKSGCTFIRNGAEHPPAEAAQHMRRKYEHFKNEIKTVDDFIRLAGTKSIKSGADYRVRLKDGKEMTSAEWLKGIVEEYRKKK